MGAGVAAGAAVYTPWWVGVANVYISGRTAAICEELVRDLEKLDKGRGVFKIRILDSLDRVLDVA